MFVYSRSAAAVLLPLAMLVAVVVWSNRNPDAASQRPQSNQTVAASLPSR